MSKEKAPRVRKTGAISQYHTIVAKLKNKIRLARQLAALTVNIRLLQLYWEIGNTIAQQEKSEGWGAKTVERLSKDLLSEFPDVKGLSVRNLRYMREFAKAYPKLNDSILQQAVAKSSPQLILQQPVAKLLSLQQVIIQIPWAHNVVLLDKVKTAEGRIFYAQKTIENGWSRNVLMHHIESGLFERTGKAINNFQQTLPPEQSDLAREAFKSPYILEFIQLSQEANERELENALIHHIKKFLLELGKGFSYVGNQYNLKVEEDDFFLDLLFFNYHLNCFVILELKVEEFKPEFAGKLNFYINTVDEKIKSPQHNPTIGILFCKTPNKTVVEYALRGMGRPLGVADYELSKKLPEKLEKYLPLVDELENHLHPDFQARIESLLSNFNNESVKEKRTAVHTERIFSKVLLPLKKSLLKALTTISKQFHETNWMIWMDRQGHTTDKSAKAYLKHQRGLFGEFRLNIELQGFKAAGTKAFSCWKSVFIKFQDYHYTIAISEHYKEVIIDNLYHQLPSNVELNKVVEKFCEELLDDITQRVKQIKSGADV